MIKINEGQLMGEIYYAGNELHTYSNNKSLITSNYNGFKSFNELLADEFNKVILWNKNIRFDRMEYIASKDNSKALQKFIENIDKNKELIYSTADNYCTYFECLDMNDYLYRYYDCIRKYSEKDFKDLILGYFSTYGNDIYKIAKKYFDENRINFGSNIDRDYGGFFMSIPFIGSGYIVIGSDNYDSKIAAFAIHEIGHAIDLEKYLFNQMKKVSIFEDYLIEVPSTAYELGFYDYLKKNKIDIDGSMILNNMRVCNTYYWLSVLQDILARDVNILCCNNYLTEDGMIYSSRDSALYGLAYYISMHLNLINNSNKEEFLKVLNNVTTMRKEMPLEGIIELTGFSIDDFVSGKYIASKIENDFLELKRRYNHL